jgi:hypothetical protein
MPCDKLAIQAAIATCVDIDEERVRLLRIRDSSHIDEILLSEALLSDGETDGRIEVLSAPEEMKFDAKGNLF